MKKMTATIPDAAYRLGGLGLFVFSAITFGLVWTFQAMTGADMNTAISIDIHSGNVMACVVILLVCVNICLFAHRLVDNGHTIRTAIILLDVAGLILVMLTDPMSTVHDGAVFAMVLLSAFWFAIMAVDYGVRELAYTVFLPLTVVPIIALISPGVGERALISYFLWMINVFYYRHMPAQGRRWD